MERIVIIGGGFAGLNLCKRLDKRKYEVCLIDRNNFHSFPPLFYQIASAGLVSANICFPYHRELRRQKGVSCHMGHVKQIDIGAKTVTTSYETLHYDRLVIAAESANNYFGICGMAGVARHPSHLDTRDAQQIERSHKLVLELSLLKHVAAPAATSHEIPAPQALGRLTPASAVTPRKLPDNKKHCFYVYNNISTL